MSKFERLTAVFDDFHSQLEGETHDMIVKLRAVWASAKSDYARALAARTVTKSAIAQGLEQGVRELPLILQSLPDQIRSRANRALSASIGRHAPDMQARDQARLAKVVERGRIRSESEYYLVRHEIDVLEESRTEAPALAKLYELEASFMGQATAA